MADFSSIKQSIADLKAKVEQASITPELLGSILENLLSRTAAKVQTRQVGTDLYLDLIDSGGTVLGSFKLPVCTGDNAGIVPGPLYTYLQTGATDGKNAMSQKGKPSGFATLGTDGKLPVAQLPALTSAMLPQVPASLLPFELRTHVCAFDGFEDLVPEQAFEQMGLSPMGAAKVHFSRSKGAFYCVKNAGSLTDRKVYLTWAGNSLMDASVAMGTEDSTRGVVPVTGKLYYCRADKAYYLWNGSYMQPELAVMEEYRHQVFDDMWLAAVGTYGSIDYTHEEEGVKRPYYLNTLWLTYEEAIKVMEAKPPRTPILTDYLNEDSGIRTNLPLKNMPSGGGGVDTDHVTISRAFNAPDLEVVNLNSNRFRFVGYHGFINAFYAAKLHTIIGNINFFNSNVVADGSSSNFTMFGHALVNVKIDQLDRNLRLVSPVISLYSLQYMLQHSSAPTNGFTLTVHPTVYAKITDTTNTEWHALLDLAASKNVNIATTA